MGHIKTTAMLSTRNLYPSKWYPPEQVVFILAVKHEVKCTRRKLYKVLRDHGVIDEYNTPQPPYDDRKLIDTEPVRIESPYSGKFKKWHDKILVNGDFILDISRMIPPEKEPPPSNRYKDGPEFDLSRFTPKDK